MRACCRAQTVLKEQWQNRAAATVLPDPAVMTSNSCFCFEVCFDSVPLGYLYKIWEASGSQSTKELSQLPKPPSTQFLEAYLSSQINFNSYSKRQSNI